MDGLSLNEVETLAAKAARGAGLSWGLAEDVGRAARRLAAAGRPWASAVVGLSTDPGPALAGARLADAPPLGSAHEQGLGFPAFVAAMAAAAFKPLRFSWPEAELVVADGRIAMATGPRLDHEGPVDLLAEPIAGPLAGFMPAREPGLPDAAVLAQLEALAWLTAVPPSDRSRLAGAGAGLQDND